MSCNTEFWLYALGSFFLGGIVTWLFMRNKIEDLFSQLSGKSDRIIKLGNDYAGLRASSQEQILAFKEDKNNLIPLPIDSELTKKHESLKVDYNNLQSKIHKLERGIKPPQNLVQKKKAVKDSSKEVIKNELLSVENQNLKKKIKNLDQYKSNYKKSIKNIESLKKEIIRLKAKVNKKKESHSIEKRVEIIKSLRTKKLKDWLSTDKAYKVRKKVSTSKLKSKS
tara:strand:- start:1876 stop:2547 length:672 start_codon:yes stop_codon:yes gene_type:complete